jgi:hypothetical protein
MSVGLPGTGIGGLFYIAGALWAPIDATLGHASGRRTEVRWRLLARQALIAMGILVALWGTGWAVGYVLTLSVGSGAGAAGGMASAETKAVVSVVRWAAVLGTSGLLVCILLLVQALRFTVRRAVPVRRAWPGRGPRSFAESGRRLMTNPAAPRRVGRTESREVA